MQVALALEIDASVDSLSTAVAEAAARVKDFFAGRDYGEDIANLFIGVILTGGGSERLHPVRKLSYKKILSSTSRITRQKMEMRNVVQYDVKPDYEAFRRLNYEQAKRFIADELVNSTSILEQHKAKFPDFDLQKFKDDLRVCLTF